MINKSKENGFYSKTIIFFCVFCLCYSVYGEHKLIKGVNYVKKCRITELLNQHENETHHLKARGTYIEKDSQQNNCVDTIRIRSEKWNVLKTIVKIIIFITTHGMY